MKSTIGVEYTGKDMTIDNNYIRAQIWDTAGQEKFRSVSNSYYRGSHGAIIVYDISDKLSFQNVPIWLDQFKQKSNADIAICLIANKSDIGKSRVITTEEGEKFAKDNELIYFETSALTGDNVDVAFQTNLRSMFITSIKV